MDFYGNIVGLINDENSKHCPFCGAGGQKIYETGKDDDNGNVVVLYRIVCQCGVTMKGKTAVNLPGVPIMLSIQKSARNAWNRRVVL